MTHYVTGLDGKMPNIIDVLFIVFDGINDFAHVLSGSAHTSFTPASMADTEPGEYDTATRSWSGTDGLRYRVPLMLIPSERVTRERSRNVKILLDNCRRICVNDELPCTSSERKFWATYRLMKYEQFIAPACFAVPATYLFFRVFHNNLPRSLRGRFLSVFLGLTIAEVWANATFPAHELLTTAMRAKTPMGDVARAEWARLQSLNIPYYIYMSYQFEYMFNNISDQFLFGGNLPALCGERQSNEL